MSFESRAAFAAASAVLKMIGAACPVCLCMKLFRAGSATAAIGSGS